MEKTISYSNNVCNDKIAYSFVGDVRARGWRTSERKRKHVDCDAAVIIAVEFPRKVRVECAARGASVCLLVVFFSSLNLCTGECCKRVRKIKYATQIFAVKIHGKKAFFGGWWRVCLEIHSTCSCDGNDEREGACVHRQKLVFGV